MIAAAVLPLILDDQTLEQVIATALASKLVACNCTTGRRFRVAFFPPDRIPAGWARIGLVDKPTEALCA